MIRFVQVKPFLQKLKKCESMKFKNIIPSILTIGNATFGFTSIIYSLNSEYISAAIFLFISLLLDGFDGRVARILNISSEFGKELDSLADIISFGVAPAIMLYCAHLQSLGFLGIIISFAIVLCGMIRLARFNLIGKKDYFVGLPIPAAGMFFATVIISKLQIEPIHLSLWILIISYLMISKINYPTFKKGKIKDMKKMPHFTTFLMFFAFLTTLVILIDPNKFLILPFMYYIIAGPILAIKK